MPRALIIIAVDEKITATWESRVLFKFITILRFLVKHYSNNKLVLKKRTNRNCFKQDVFSNRSNWLAHNEFLEPTSIQIFLLYLKCLICLGVTLGNISNSFINDFFKMILHTHPCSFWAYAIAFHLFPNWITS